LDSRRRHEQRPLLHARLRGPRPQGEGVERLRHGPRLGEGTDRDRAESRRAPDGEDREHDPQTDRLLPDEVATGTGALPRRRRVQPLL